MNTYLILGQICGFISLALYVTAYQMKEPRKTQLLFVPADIFCGLQYVFLGSISSFLVLMLAAGRDLAGAFASDRVLRLVAFVYLALVFGMTFFKVEVWQEVLPVVGTTLATMAVLSRSDFYRFRFLMFVHHIMWMWFNIWIMSFAGIILVAMNGSSNLIGAWRYWHGNRKIAKETPHVEL